MKNSYVIVRDGEKHVIYNAQGEIVSLGIYNKFTEAWIRRKKEQGCRIEYKDCTQTDKNIK